MQAINLEVPTLPHQIKFLKDFTTPYLLLLGGYGCVSADTRVWTSDGLVRISDITTSTRVLSWSEKDQKFQLSLSSGAFPRGRANLHRVSTELGKFDAAGHHRAFSSAGTYQKVDALSSVRGLACCILWCTDIPFFSAWLLSLLDAPHYSKKDEDCLRNYADEARLYGQQFLNPEESAQASVPLATGVRRLCHNYDLQNISHLDDSKAQKQEHSRPGQFFGHARKMGLVRLIFRLLVAMVTLIATLFFERISDSLPKSKQFPLNIFVRHIAGLFALVSQAFVFFLRSFKPHFIDSNIIEVSEKEHKAAYYDMLVLDTNNYICENGFIHHNCGKTHGFALKALVMCMLNPGYCGTVMEPTGPLLDDILVPALEEILEITQTKYTHKNNQGKPNYYINVGGGKITELRLRSAENWRRQIGSNQAFVGVDEIDTMKPDDALKMMQKSKPRIRKGKHLQFFASTTPEGFGFCYKFFEKGKDAEHRTIHAKTADNPFLPDNYIPDLKKLYPENLIDAYLNGNYVNLNSGRVYPNFSRKTNSTDATWSGKEPLHIGMDFNVTKMSAVVHVIRGGNPFAVREFVNIYDTPAMIQALKQEYPTANVFIYPDASGKNRKTNNASETDLELLKQAGYHVLAKKSNPLVKNRVNSMNAMFMNGVGVARYRVNIFMCPNYTESLEQQVYDDNGQPDKRHDLDHLPDAGGYFITYSFPITSRPAFVERTA